MHGHIHLSVCLFIRVSVCALLLDLFDRHQSNECVCNQGALRIISWMWSIEFLFNKYYKFITKARMQQINCIHHLPNLNHLGALLASELVAD